ncbi:MAG TPA: phosphoglycerate mutase family protein [Acidimicrobiales bacterium]|nr:phosphoglycerate mutase family protein [Acidimicrobiales bacterium]
MILLVRHAVAVSRKSWPGDDNLRPLTRRGEQQAAGLVELLSPYPADRILSSPAVRCVATVTPLAEARSLKVETAGALREGRGHHALDLVLDAVGDVAVCTHGDVIDVVLAGLRHVGWPIPSRPRCAKGSTWVLNPRGPCVYLPPPA